MVGPGPVDHQVTKADDYLYIPAGVSHSAANRSQTHPATAVVAPTDPNVQERVVLQPEFDDLLPGAPPRRADRR